LSFGDEETLNTELDFQYVLPEPKSFNDQTTQTNQNPSIVGTRSIDDDSLEFFSASDESEQPRKRLHAN
jgi:hypothetical protein